MDQNQNKKNTNNASNNPANDDLNNINDSYGENLSQINNIDIDLDNEDAAADSLENLSTPRNLNTETYSDLENNNLNLQKENNSIDSVDIDIDNENTFSKDKEITLKPEPKDPAQNEILDLDNEDPVETTDFENTELHTHQKKSSQDYSTNTSSGDRQEIETQKNIAEPKRNNQNIFAIPKKYSSAPNIAEYENSQSRNLSQKHREANFLNNVNETKDKTVSNNDHVDIENFVVEGDSAIRTDSPDSFVSLNENQESEFLNKKEYNQVLPNSEASSPNETPEKKRSEIETNSYKIKPAPEDFLLKSDSPIKSPATSIPTKPNPVLQNKKSMQNEINSLIPNAPSPANPTASPEKESVNAVVQENKDAKDTTGSLTQESVPPIAGLTNKEKELGVELKRIRTYEDDVKNNIQSKKITTAKILIEEQKKRQAQETTEQTNNPRTKGNILKTIFIIIFIILGLGVGYYAYEQGLFIKKTQNARPNPVLISDIIQLDSLKEITTGQKTNTEIIAEIRRIINSPNTLPVNGIEKIELSKIEEVLVNEKITEQTFAVSTTEFLNIMETRTPDSLIRSLKDDFILGQVKTSQTTEPFIIFQVNDFERAYSGMFEWEDTMILDLKDIFYKNLGSTQRFPREVSEINEDIDTNTAPQDTEVELETETFSNEDEGAVDTQKEPTEPEPTIESTYSNEFTDLILSNQDTRTILNNQGQVIFFYTIINKENIIITTNVESLIILLNKLNSSKIVR